MSNEEKVTKWLEDNHEELSWTRTSGDSPATKSDAEFINRSEAYEIRDIIVKYYEDNNLGFNDKNFERTYNKIMTNKKGYKVTRQDMLEYLVGTLDKK